MCIRDSIKNAIIVVIGPGFLKEDFIGVGREEAPEIFKGSVVENSGQGGMAGIHEVISKGTLPKTVAQIKIQEEMGSVETLRGALAKDLATYGNKEVKDAIVVGAAESMLIISEKTRIDKVSIPDIIATQLLPNSINVIAPTPAAPTVFAIVFRLSIADSGRLIFSLK